MDSREIIASIGKTEESPEVQKVLSALGFTQKLKMPKDDIDVRVTLLKLGISLIFKPENPKSSRLVLTSVKFISDKEKGNASFPGALPSGLLFSDGRSEALNKLGAPSEEMPEFRQDIWTWQEFQLVIKYAKEAPNQIAVITVEVPFEDD